MTKIAIKNSFNLYVVVEFTEIIQSGVIKVVRIINKIEIPSNLYKGVRYIDLVLFIDLWKGRISLDNQIIDDKIHNLKSIKKLCDSLTLNADLYFVKKLMELYPYKPK